MSTFEKSIVIIISAVALCMLIAILVLSSLTAFQMHELVHYSKEELQKPHRIIHRDRHGNILEEEVEEEVLGPPRPIYKRPLGAKSEK